MQTKKSTFGWILTFAGQKRSGYLMSVIFAVLGAAFQMLPFFVMAWIIGKLLAGDRILSGYLTDCAVMAAFWLLRVGFHALSTAQSHRSTFAVLGNIRKQGLQKLARSRSATCRPEARASSRTSSSSAWTRSSRRSRTSSRR